ncbi:hypothetical protein [Treponema sp.]|uniref:hypothetical protein n=1 Tax=Treponema sp. TaxID=166 RepID=UPI00388FA9E2
MNIEESELREILDKQRKSVESKRFPIESLLSLFVFILSAVLGQVFTHAIWVRILFWLIVLCHACFVLFLIFKYFKNRYSETDFLKDIKNSERVRNFSLVVLKDISGKFKNSYLLRYDCRWKCFLLPYLQTHDQDDKEFIQEYVDNVLELSDAEIKDVKFDDVVKYSVSDNMTKKYHHTFYLVNFNASDSKLITKRTIVINGEKFKWFTIDQMKRNKAIEQKNSETVNFIARNF